MSAAIKTETNGRVDIQIFPNNQLGADTDVLSQLRSGRVEFFTMSGLILATLVPVASINGMGFAFPDYDTVWKAMDGELGADRDHSAKSRADYDRFGHPAFRSRRCLPGGPAGCGAGGHAVGAGVWRYRGEDLNQFRKANGSEIIRAFVVALPALALPFVIRAAVVEGVATATEVSTIGIVYGFVVGILVYRRFDRRRLVPMLVKTACLSGAILI
jgi:TRAP-type mannitol/chloroaromatic compound transport system permease large subunit